MHDLCIFVRVIDGGIETIFYVAGVDIAVAQGDSVGVCSLGHNARSKCRLCVCRNGGEILKG